MGVPNRSPSRPSITAVVLAGGVGKRFWPLSSEDLPKQFLPLLSDEPMIIETLKRLIGAPFDVRKVYILTHERYQSWFKSHPFFEHAPFDIEIVYEPESKNTGPSLTWVALLAKTAQSNPSPCLVLSADHWISPTPIFQQQVCELYEDCISLNTPTIYTIGIPPTFPSTDYGYIACDTSSSGLMEVQSFKEKPDQATAQRYVSEGTYVWNAGIFFFQPEHLIELIKEYTPELRAHLPTTPTERFKHAFFRSVPALSIDHGLLERTPQRKCLRATFNWSDIGTWPGLRAWQEIAATSSPYFKKALGDTDANNTVFCDHTEGVILLGCQDMYVVNCNGKLLIAHKDHIHRLKDVLDANPKRS